MTLYTTQFVQFQQRRKKKQSADGTGDAEDDGSQGSDKPVTVIESSSGKVLSGDEAPLLSQLHQWLETHPGWEVADTDDDDSDMDQDGNYSYYAYYISHLSCI